MKRRSVLRAGVAGGVAALLPRFAIGQSADARALRFVPQANLTVLDPIVTTAAVTANHAWMVWDTLFGVNAAQQAKPQMADGYTISDNGRTYLIKLREGLRWHDGEPVRAQDCAASLARWAVRNTFGQTAAKSVDEWGVADDKTVKITLKRPFPLLIDAIAVQNSFIMPERLAKTDPFKAINEVVGSGPYRFLKDEFVPGSSAAWEKFDGYAPRQEPAEWSSGGKIANFQRIEWKIITDAATASAALQNGEVDWYEQAQADLVPLLRRNSDIVIAPSNPQGYIGGLRFNCLHPLGIPKHLEALALRVVGDAGEADRLQVGPVAAQFLYKPGPPAHLDEASLLDGLPYRRLHHFLILGQCSCARHGREWPRKSLNLRKPTCLHAGPVAIATANDRSGVNGEAHRRLTLWKKSWIAADHDLQSIAIVGIRRLFWRFPNAAAPRPRARWTRSPRSPLCWPATATSPARPSTSTAIDI